MHASLRKWNRAQPRGVIMKATKSQLSRVVKHMVKYTQQTNWLILIISNN